MVREINSYTRLVEQMGLSEDLPDNFIRAVQFFTFLDLVCDGAEIEGFATPSKNGKTIPTQFLGPSRADIQTLDIDEAEYIKDAQKDIFLNGRPIRTASGDENIINTSLALRVGADNQQIMTGVDSLRRSETITSTDITVKNNGDPEANKVTGSVEKGLTKDDTPTHIIITLSWASLRQLHPFDGSSQGLHITEGEFKDLPIEDLRAGAVHIRFKIFNKHGDQILQSDPPQLAAVSVGSYARDYQLQIPASAIENQQAIDDNFPLEVHVLRLDQELRSSSTGRNPFADIKQGRDTVTKNVYEEGERRFTEFKFAGLQSLIPSNPTTATFPNSAYIGLRYSAEQYPRIPQRQYRIRGIKVKVPTGTNDGTVAIDNDNGRIIYPTGYSFINLNNDVNKKRWTTDPVWILYALLTESYGLQIPESTIDKASFFAASQYCSTPITGEDTPRYSFNGVINKRRKALNLIKEIASLMRATIYYRNGSIKIALDKLETNTSYLFTNANVVDGKFSYSGLDKDKKFTQVNVSYFNMDIQELDQVSVSSDQIDSSLQDSNKYGINQTNVEALYTTDRSQAIRFGRSILYTNLLESEVVNFSCSLEAASILEPFMIIKIADRLKETLRASGRIKSVTSSTVLVVDDSTNTTVGVVGDSFLVIDKEGGLQESTIQSVSGSTITLSSALSPEPQAGTIWAVKTGNVQHRKYRVTNIKQATNFTFSITAIVYDDNKYSFIDNADLGTGIGREPTTLLDVIDPPPISSIKEELIVVNNNATHRLVLDFGYVDGAKKYKISYKQSGNGPFVSFQFTNQFIINNHPSGLYKFELRSVSANDVLSVKASEKTFQAVGIDTRPGNVQNLRAVESGKNLILNFDPSVDLDVLNGGLVRVKFIPNTTGGGLYDNATFTKDVDGSSTEIIIFDYENGEYLLKFIDVNTNESESATQVVVNKIVPSDRLVALQIRENSAFVGTPKVNMVKNNTINALVLTSGTNFDSLTNFNNLTTATETFASLDLVSGGVASSGSYTFNANDLDLGSAMRFTIEPHIVKSGFTTVTLWDDYTDLMNTWPITNFTGIGDPTDSADVTFKIAKSQTATASTSFETFTTTDITARTLSFKIDVVNNSSYKNVKITELGVNIFFEPRTERSIDNSSANNGVLTSSATGATTVTFATPFFTGSPAVGGSTTAFKPVIALNVNNMQDNDFYTIDSVSSTGFVVSIKNDDKLFGSAGEFVQREFTYSAFGYGSG
tara:strand:+ start:2074 stop:5781 length:3708 start_codon:yes stop_codon:yes gene_type:complete